MKYAMLGLIALLAILMTGCAGDGLSPEFLSLLEVAPDEQKIVCFQATVQSPVPGSPTQANAGILALPNNVELTSDELIAAMNACF